MNLGLKQIPFGVYVAISLVIGVGAAKLTRPPRKQFVRSAQNAGFSVQFHLKRSCEFGMLDAIYTDLSVTPQNSLLLTVESEGDSKPILSTYLQASDIHSEKIFQMAASNNLPSSSRIYLCSDRTKTGSCQSKHLTSEGMILKGKLDKQEAQPEDRTYLSWAVDYKNTQEAKPILLPISALDCGHASAN